MTPDDDDFSVSGNDQLADIVTMAMARRTLRGLVPDAPPTPSEQLAVVLREGLAVTPPRFSWGRLTGRIASLGLAAKLMLAAGVAVASAGGAATAVAFTHQSNHHEPPDSPRNHPGVVVTTPTAPTPGADTDDSPARGQDKPGASPTTGTERHDGGATSGHDGTSGEHSDSGSGDSTSGSHDGKSGGGADDSTSGTHDRSAGSDGGSGTDGGHSGSPDTSGGSSSGSDGGHSGSDSGSGSGSRADGGSTGGTPQGASDGGTPNGGTSRD